TYITHLQMRTIQHGYKKVKKELKKRASTLIKLNFYNIDPSRTKKILDLEFEEIQYNFKLVKVLKTKTISTAIRYFESNKRMRILKGKLLIQKAQIINRMKNRIVNKVF